MNDTTNTASRRRDALFSDVFTNDWDYAEPLFDLTFRALENLEGLVGAEAVNEPFLALLAPIVRDFAPSDVQNWRDAMDEPQAFFESLPINRLFRDALLYGFGGIVPEDIPVPERAGWIESCVEQISAFAARTDVRTLYSGDNVLLRIANLAASRYAIDTGTGEIDAHSMSILGGISEGRVRNLLSGSDSALERGPNGGVVAMSAAAWLQKKKGFLASIWQQEDIADESDEEGPAIPADRMIFVPVARDGSMFTPDLQRNGAYRIGAKGCEEDIADFASALARLNAMPVPRWRRPNEKGLWGIVSGVSWQRIEKK